MTYAEAFRYDRRTLVIRVREHDEDTFTARDTATGATADGHSVHAAVRRLRGVAR